MKTIVCGVAHPVGQSEDYDGFFYKESEFTKLAKDLLDKPVYFEHDQNCKVGKILSAWPGKGKNNDTEMFVMFELDNNTLPGILADKMIQDEHICDLSLGHKVTVENSEGVNRVINKEAFEVSICEKGARPNTHIYQVYRYKNPDEKKYINKYDQFYSSKITKTMSEVTEKTAIQEDTQDKIEPKEEQDTSNNIKVTESILEQFRTLQERNKQMESELAHFKENGKRLREDTLKNGVRDFIMKIVEEEDGLKQYSEHMQKLMNDMVEAESATPMLQFLQCAAKKSQNSVTELEKAYQERKEYEQQIKKLRLELERNEAPLFAKPEERVQAAVASSKPQPEQTQTLAQGPGLKKFNLNLWQEISNDILKHC